MLLGGEAAPSILAGIWGAALVGVAFKMVSARRWAGITLTLYLAMGWAIVVIGGPILNGVSNASFTPIAAGGVIYTLGVGFLYWERLRFQNAIWHAFVLAASFLIYAAILLEITRLAPGM